MPYDKSKHKIIDLRKLTDPDDNTYICEFCDVRLIPYFDIKGERLTRGKLFQCGKCGLIKDTAMDNLQRPEQLTSKGDNQAIFFKQIRQPQAVKPKPFDVEEDENLFLIGQNFHVIKTRITSGDGRILRND